MPDRTPDRPLVLVISKAPVPGHAKTRLVPPLTQDAAAELATAMLLDTIDGCVDAGVEVRLLAPSSADAAALHALTGLEVDIQEGRGLADALSAAIRRHSAAGPVAIVSSDIPGPPTGAVSEAFSSLDAGADVVLGPSPDGGYWLVAMAEFNAAPFRDIPWSTPACLAVTEERIADAGKRSQRVASRLDIDTFVDLAMAVHQPPADLGRRTGRVLEGIASGLEVPRPPAFHLDRSELVSAAPWRSFVRDRLASADGRSAQYGYLAVPRAVFVVAVTTTDELLLVRQYRHPVRDWTIEVPAGAVENGESARQAAERELAEEVGGIGGTWRHLGSFFSSSAHLSLRSDAFLVTGVEVGASNPEPGEELAIIRMPIGEAVRTARDGGFVEGQTALSILLAAEHLEC